MVVPVEQPLLVSKHRAFITHDFTSARSHALVPRVLSLRIALYPAGRVPTASAGAARAFAGIVGDALGTRDRGTSSRFLSCSVHIGRGVCNLIVYAI